MPIIFNSLPTEKLRITSRFGNRKDPITGKLTPHRGVDIGSSSSYDTVRAVMPGIVSNSYYNSVRGWVIIIDHGIINSQKVFSLYQHMKEQSHLALRSAVSAGQIIGIMGNTGKSTGKHLHFELIPGGVQIDPEPYLYNIQPDKKSDETESDDVIKYKKLEDIPTWAVAAVTAAMGKDGIDGMKVLTGDQYGNINLTESMLRLIVMNYRLGLYR